MTGRRIGVHTNPGHLTYFLEDFGLTRKELASRVQVTVRTIHNIEHGRKPVDPQLVARVADVLNDHARRIGMIEPPQLTADHFIRSPEASTSVFLQTILNNEPESLFVGDSPIAGDHFHWLAPGCPQQIPFAGEYAGRAARVLIRTLHQSVGAVDLEDVRTMKHLPTSTIVVAAVAKFQHPLSRETLRFKAYLEVESQNGKLGQVSSTYDTALLSSFLRTGCAPKERKSDQPGW
jgi:transcriptional regulator with XRE-family HTH domain